MRLSGSPERFVVAADLDLQAKLDFGELGVGVLGIKSFALASDGAFSATRGAAGLGISLGF